MQSSVQEEPTIADRMETIMSAQHVAGADAIDCAKVSDEQFKDLGDAVMGKLAGDEKHHTMMEDMMGGEDTAPTVAMHIMLGKRYLGCNGSMPMMMGMTSMLLTMHKDEKLGNYLADSDGRTLYVFSSDRHGVSNCSGACLQNWPPYFFPKGFKNSNTIRDLGILQRSNSSSQLMWENMPLYYYSQDKKPGDTLGNGIKNLWRVITF